MSAKLAAIGMFSMLLDVLPVVLAAAAGAFAAFGLNRLIQGNAKLHDRKD